MGIIQFNSRIKTENGNYIALGNLGYGEYNIYWLDGQMDNPKFARVEEWLWATTWGTTIEHGDWFVTMSQKNIYPTAAFQDSSNRFDDGWTALWDNAIEFETSEGFFVSCMNEGEKKHCQQILGEEATAKRKERLLLNTPLYPNDGRPRNIFGRPCKVIRKLKRKY